MTERSDGGPGVPEQSERWLRLPEALLAPLLETAGETLRGLPPADVPPAGRRLATFDRRGLATPTARSQLRRLVETEEAYAALVREAFATRADVGALAAAWSRGEAAQAVVEAAEGGTVPLLASFLWAQQPPGWEFAVGLALAAFQWEQTEGERATELERLERRAAEATEARRRAEEARERAEEKLARLVEEQRSARRDRSPETGGPAQELAAARRLVAEREASLAAVRAQLADAQARAAREATRARDAEERERALRADLDAAAARSGGGASAAALVEVAEAATDLAGRLRKLSRQTGPPSPPAADRDRPAPEALPRRSPVQIPPGMRGDEPAAADVMVRTPGVTVVVDGYNVSMLAWPDATGAVQRERLADALVELHLRARCRIVLVWDGADVPVARTKGRKGVTVIFSPAGVEADDVVVDQVRAQPRSVPVLVVSSDGAVRARAEMNGAQVMASAVFLGVLRR